MGLETVVDDIKEEARAEAEEIVESARQDREEMLSDAREEADRISSEEVAAAEKEAEEIHERTVSGAKLEARKMRSEAEKRLLAELRSATEERLAGLEDGREELTRELLLSAVDELGEEEGSVLAAGRDQDLVSDLLDDVDGYELSGEADVLGGVVVEGPDGDVRVDNSFDSMLERIWDERLREVSERLLEEG